MDRCHSTYRASVLCQLGGGGQGYLQRGEEETTQEDCVVTDTRQVWLESRPPACGNLEKIISSF